MRPARVEQLVRPVLEPGEEVLWMGAPHPAWTYGGFIWIGAVIAIPLALMVRFFTRTSWTELMPLPLIWLPQIVPLVIGQIRRLSWTAYAITNRRVVVVIRGMEPSVRSYRYVDPDQMEVKPRLAHCGDLLFMHELSPAGAVKRAGFRHVADPRGVAAILRAMLGSGHRSPAEVAVWALLCRDDPRQQEGPLDDLTRLGPATEEPLRRALADSDPHVRAAIARALGRLGSGQSVSAPVLAALATCVNDPADVVRQAAAASLMTLGTAAFVPLMQALRGAGDPRLRTRIEEVLGRLNARDKARACLDALRQGDVDGDDAVRAFVDASPLQRSWVIRAWSEIAHSRPDLFWLLLLDRRLWVRLLTSEALGMGAAGTAGQRLETLLLSADAEDALVGAVGRGCMGDGRAAGPLITALESDDRGLRLAAAGALAQLGASAGAALEPLQKQMRHEKDPHVKSACQTAVNRITFALRRQPTELQAADAPLGRGTEPETAPAPAGTGTEPEYALPIGTDAERVSAVQPERLPSRR